MPNPNVHSLCDALTSILSRASEMDNFAPLMSTNYILFVHFLFTIILSPVILSLSIFSFSCLFIYLLTIPISRTICVRWMTFTEFLFFFGQ